MAAEVELTPERRELLSLSARIIALEHANLVLSTALGVLAKASHGIDIAPLMRDARLRYENAAERSDFAMGLTEAERRFLADQVNARLASLLEPLTPTQP